jgi:hypothetical protein
MPDPYYDRGDMDGDGREDAAAVVVMAAIRRGG